MRNYIYFCFVLLLVTGCYEDKGNYDYTVKPRIEIEGLGDSHRRIAMLDDPILNIPVTLNTEYPESDLKFIWTIGLNGATKLDTVCREKDLKFNISDAPVELRPGTYNIVLSVEYNPNNTLDKEHSYTAYATTVLSVETRFSRGFYVLKQTNSGDTDMDFFIMEDKFADATLVEQPAKFKVEDSAFDVLTQSIGQSVKGKPHVLAQLTNHPYTDPITLERKASHCLGITTDQSAIVMLCADMTKVADLQTMFWDPSSATGKPGRFARGYSGSMYFSEDGQYYITSGDRAVGTGRFGPPAEIEGQGGSQWAAPMYGLYSQVFIVWDEVNSRFLMNVSGSVTAYAGTGDSSEPQPNNIKSKMMFMGAYYPLGTSFGDDYMYAIMQPNNGSARQLYKLSRVDSRPETPIDWVKTFNTTSKFNTATCYAINSWDIRMLYCVTDGALYCLSPGNSANDGYSEESITLQGIPDGEHITYVANRFWWMYSASNVKMNYLVVGSSKGDGKYTVSMYEMVGGKPYGAPKVQFNGIGTIADVQYMAPQGGNSSDLTYVAFGYDGYGLSY